MRRFPYYHGQYVRIAEYPIHMILPYVVNTATVLKLKKSGVKKGTPAWVEETERDYDGNMVKMFSQRYQLFAKEGTTCVECGLVGTFFGLEIMEAEYGKSDRYHFNLYGEDQDGTEVLITKDHIIPKSRGGKNVLSNYQVMCVNCNTEKGDKLPTECDNARYIELAIKSLEMVAHVQDIDPTDCTPMDVEQLHYGAKLALKHLKDCS
jgi:hypothetical protein